MKTKIITVAYGIKVRIPDTFKQGDELIDKIPAVHGVRDCGHHYNIFEKDGFPQDRFYGNIRKRLKEHE